MTQTIEDAESYTTRDLLGKIYVATIVESQPAKFLCQRGTGRAIMARVRMELTRARKRMEAKGRRYTRFTLTQDIIPWTDSKGNTHDCVILNAIRTHQHENLELLDDLIARKGIELS